MKNDSTADTKAHIKRVQDLLEEMRIDLEFRAVAHDRSKLEEPEKSAFDRLMDLSLSGLTYGSEEYKACLRAEKPAIQHHYEHNSHHPEHYPNGVDGMTLLDLLEMFCDWKAAGERHSDSSMEKSIQHNKDRFKMSEQLVNILENSRKEMGWK